MLGLLLMIGIWVWCRERGCPCLDVPVRTDYEKELVARHELEHPRADVTVELDGSSALDGSGMVLMQKGFPASNAHPGALPSGGIGSSASGLSNVAVASPASVMFEGELRRTMTDAGGQTQVCPPPPRQHAEAARSQLCVWAAACGSSCTRCAAGCAHAHGCQGVLAPAGCRVRPQARHLSAPSAVMQRRPDRCTQRCAPTLGGTRRRRRHEARGACADGGGGLTGWARVQLQVLEEIGRGAYGVVHRGSWKTLRVTVKKIPFPSGSGGSAPTEYANSAWSCAHPNIIKTFHCEVRPPSCRRAAARMKPGLPNTRTGRAP